MRSTWKKWFRRERRKAGRLVDDPVGFARAVDAAADKAEKLDRGESARGPLQRVWDDLHTSMRLLRAWSRRDYVGVGRGTIALLVGALLYFVSPIDAIIDAIPVLGYLDDAAVIAWVVSQVRSELDAFRAWETRTARLASVPASSDLASIEPKTASN